MLGALGTLGAAGLAGCAGGDDSGSASGTVKIGVMQPLSGDIRYYGAHSLWGFFSGLAHKADSDPIEEASTGSYTVTVGDVDYELVVRDSLFSADEAQTIATNLVTNEEVDVLFGCASSAAARRVIQQVTGQTDVPTVIGPAAAADITSDSELCNANVFRASENTAMDARSGGRYVAQETDVSSVYLFGADYSFGRAVVNNYRTVLENNGVEIAGERFVNQGYSEWEGLLDNAEEAGADGIVGGFTVQTLPNLFTSYLSGDYSYRVFGGVATRITAAVVGGLLQNELGSGFTAEDVRQAGMGPFTTRYHWNQYDNEINTAFRDMYTGAYGTQPDLFSSGTFTAASAIVQAVEESGSTDGADIAEAMRGMTVSETPKGSDAYTFQSYNNQARSPMTVAYPVPTGDTANWEAAIKPGEPLSTIGADQTTIPADSADMGCDL